MSGSDVRNSSETLQQFHQEEGTASIERASDHQRLYAVDLFRLGTLRPHEWK